MRKTYPLEGSENRIVPLVDDPRRFEGTAQRTPDTLDGFEDGCEADAINSTPSGRSR